ncbi:MAG: hypothetical protein J5793_02240 [Clostridia bacterium]|nr:hypothetical protein [Clostridia bacterium]
MFKKVITCLLILALLCSCAFVFSSCGSKKLSGDVTIEQWIEKEGEGEDFTVTVKLVELLNPYYARVEDEQGNSTLLFGLWVDGEPKAFEEMGVAVGDTIVIKNPVYNIYDGSVEMKEATLVEKK